MPVTRWLVRCRDGAPTSAATDGDPAEAMEPSLMAPTGQLLRRFPTAAMQRKYLAYVVQRVHRNPRDLQAHVQRILMQWLLRDAEGVAEALRDLQRILGTRGDALRARLYTQVAGLLTPAWRRWLDPRGPQATSTDAARPGASGPPPAGFGPPRHPIVIARAEPGAPERALLALARGAVERGHDDVAQCLLEGALATDPGDAETCAALLALYRRRRARFDLARTRTALLGRRLALPAQWQALAAELAGE